MDRKTIESQYNIKLPNLFENYSLEIQENIVKYISELTPIEKKAYNIASEHLGSSFHLLRSNGYIEWNKSKSK
jgi:hypothetical protein